MEIIQTEKTFLDGTGSKDDHQLRIERLPEGLVIMGLEVYASTDDLIVLFDFCLVDRKVFSLHENDLDFFLDGFEFAEESRGAFDD